MIAILNKSTVVKEYDFIKPDIHETEYLLHGFFEDCRNKFFHTFENRLVYDIKFTNVSNHEEVIFTNTHRPMEIKTELT